eukprot:13308263-Ditylum_brightwellii.AAC.1
MEVTASLLKMIRKQQWLGDEVTATYSTAHKGFSHFALTDLSKDEVAVVNEAMKLLAEATHHHHCRPKSGQNQTGYSANRPYTNLVHALFGPLLPLFLDNKMVIKALTQLKCNALKTMNLVTKASIYWILFLQSRHFLSGETAKLAEYKVMVDNFTAKQANIAHAELPEALIPGQKR